MTPELLRERLAQAGDERMKVAEDLFGVADFLRTNSSVQRALTDPSREQSDRDALVDRLFAPVVSAVSIQCLHDLVAGHWSRPRDIVHAVEETGCDAVLLSAQFDGVLEETEAQLVAVSVFLQSHRDLRNELSDLSALLRRDAQILPRRCSRVFLASRVCVFCADVWDGPRMAISWESCGNWLFARQTSPVDASYSLSRHTS